MQKTYRYTIESKGQPTLVNWRAKTLFGAQFKALIRKILSLGTRDFQIRDVSTGRYADEDSEI